MTGRSSPTHLFILLSHAFQTFCRIYTEAMATDVSEPSLGVWSNLLRPFDDGMLDQRELIRRAVISNRAARALVRDLERLSWLTIEKPARGQTLLKLTPDGQRARTAGARLVNTAVDGFKTQFGDDRSTRLCEALAALANQLEIELPWYLTGYGLTDSSLTGGSHVPGQPGPPRIPAPRPRTGQWSFVTRPPMQLICGASLNPWTGTSTTMCPTSQAPRTGCIVPCLPGRVPDAAGQTLERGAARAFTRSYTNRCPGRLPIPGRCSQLR